MGLLAKLGLPDRRTLSAGPAEAPLPAAAPPVPFAKEAVDARDPDGLAFPVTIAGFTRAMLQQRVRDDQQGIALALGDVQRAVALTAKAEQAVAPLAAAVEKLMKTPVAQRVAEIQANANEKMRAMGRDAVNARAVVRLNDAVYALGRELLKDARSQLDRARKSLDAQNMTNQAAELRRQAAEIAAAFDLLTGLFDTATGFKVDDVTLAGNGLKMLTWGLKALAGVDALNAKATALEAAAQALNEQVVREAFEAAAQHVHELSRQVRPLLAELEANLKSYDQQRGEVEALFDQRSQGGFRFAPFVKALQAGAASGTALDAALLEAQAATRRIDSVAEWLAGMLGIEGRCLTHHRSRERSPFEPDPRKVQEETLVMKGDLRAAVKALASARKRAETLTLGIQLQAGDVLERGRRWTAYYDEAQTALFLAPAH